MFGDDIPSENLTALIGDGFIKVEGQKYTLTDKGLDEKNRLCTLCGLNIKYSSENKSN
jgi:predicted transcriptional regulator